MLPACQQDSTECHHVHFADRVTDNRKSVLPDLSIGRDVVGQINVTFIDLVLGNELVDVDGPCALNLDGIELLVFDNEVLALGDLIPSRCVLPRHHVAGFEIHILLLQAIAGLPIDAIETDLFAELTRLGRERSDKKRGTAEGSPSNSRAGPWRYSYIRGEQIYNQKFSKCFQACPGGPAMQSRNPRCV